MKIIRPQIYIPRTEQRGKLRGFRGVRKAGNNGRGTCQPGLLTRRYRLSLWSDELLRKFTQQGVLCLRHVVTRGFAILAQVIVVLQQSLPRLLEYGSLVLSYLWRHPQISESDWLMLYSVHRTRPNATNPVQLEVSPGLTTLPEIDQYRTTLIYKSYAHHDNKTI